MKITSENYFATVARIGVENLSPALKKGHELIEKATKSGTDWKSYGTFKKQFDLTFEVLAKFMEASEKSKQVLPVKTDKPNSIHKEKSHNERAAVKPYAVETKVTAKKKSKDQPRFNSKDVELISPETAFIKRFASLNNKTKTKEQVLSFIRSLQKSIVERRIRITSKHGKLIEYIQQFLVEKYNKATKKNIEFSFPENDLIKYQKIGGGEVVLNSIRFIKAYIGLQGREMTKEKAKSLFNRIVSAVEANKLTTSDKYYKHIKVILNSLEKFVKQKGTTPNLPITQAELNGLEGVLKECGCDVELNGIDNAELNKNAKTQLKKDGVMTVEEARNAKFRSVPLDGDYLKLIGKMCLPTSLLVYGLGGSRKTSFVLLFTQYLASLGFKILYVAKEQYNTPTFTELLNTLNINVGDNFTIVKDLTILNPKNFDFVVLDSKDDMDIGLSQFVSLKQKYPNQSFILISQATKDGNFTGNGRWRNVVDVMLYAENGVIKSGTDKNRWGGSSQMVIA